MNRSLSVCLLSLCVSLGGRVRSAVFKSTHSKSKDTGLGMVAHIFNPNTLGRLRQENCCKFKAQILQPSRHNVNSLIGKSNPELITALISNSTPVKPYLQVVV